MTYPPLKTSNLMEDGSSTSEARLHCPILATSRQNTAGPDTN